MARRFAIVTPCFNEADILSGLAASIDAQSLPAVAWIVVDDGSTDDTHEVACRLADARPAMRVLRRERAGGYAASEGAEAAAFNLGLRALVDDAGWDVVVKLDADIVLDPDFLEALDDAFAADATLGLAGGVLLVERRGRVIEERPGGDHTRGATKAYRRDCLHAIGGAIVERLGWDTIDEIQAELAGFRYASVPRARARQVRPTSATDGSVRGKARLGRASYLIGYPAWGITARALRRAADPPLVIGSVAMVAGYMSARLRREPRSAPPDVVRHLRAAQRRRLRDALSL